MNILKYAAALSLPALAALAISACATDGQKSRATKKELADYVNPFIGTAYVGHTFPGASLPFGAVQPSPDTRAEGGHWDYCAGYKYEDDTIYSFSQTHMNGTGCPDLGDVAFMPFAGAGNEKNPSSPYKKENQFAGAGYYKVTLDKSDTVVEISATEHVAIYKITYGADGGGLLLNLKKGMANMDNRVIDCQINFDGDTSISGKQKVRGFIPARDIAFKMEFSRPLKSGAASSGKMQIGKYEYALDFGLKKGEVLLVKVAMSSTDIEGAGRNMDAELPHWDFERVKSDARDAWEKILNKIELDASEIDRENFYTAMYHLCLQPNNIADVDGAYLGTKSNAKKFSADNKYYTSWSIWDTYRAAHSMYTIIAPDMIDGFVNSMLLHFDDMGFLPINVYYGKETYCMIGNHAISIIAESMLKGFDGFDREAALNAMVVSSTKNLPKSDWTVYEKYGYYPFDIVKTESVSRTLESCYNDCCIARVAKTMSKDGIEKKFAKRSLYYKNLFDPSTKFMRGKDSNGKWREPFNPFDFSHDGTIGGDYTEGSAWQYTWHVQQDVPELIKMLGGDVAFCERLETLFTAIDARGENAKKSCDITGLIGQYVQGNEPSHHIIYMFSLANQPHKTAELVREVFDKFYLNKPDGLCGNDDCGQMSAWYMFSALGFYPIDPSSGEYIFGAPQIKGAKINLQNGKTFTMKARNLSKENKYVKSVKLNGKDISERKFITYKEIMDGATLEFEMTK